MRDIQTLLQWPSRPHAIERRHMAAAYCIQHCMASAASCVAVASVVVAGHNSVAVDSASLGWPGWDGVVDEGVDTRKVVVGDIARRCPCRIEEGRDEGATTSQG